MTKNIETWQIAGVLRNAADSGPLHDGSLFFVLLKHPQAVFSNAIGITFFQVIELMKFYGVKDKDQLKNKEFISDTPIAYDAWILFYSTLVKAS